MSEAFDRIALAAMDRPLAEPEWLRLLTAWRGEPGFWWLDSARVDGRLGRLSFAGAEPYAWLRSKQGRVELEVLRSVRPGLAPGTTRLEAEPLDAVRALLPRSESILYSARPLRADGHRDWHAGAGLPAGLALPFLGGAVGYFGYELAASLEPRVAFEQPDDLDWPELCLALVDRVLAFDHREERLFVLSLGFAEGDADGAGARSTRSRAIDASRGGAEALAERVAATLGGAVAPSAGPAPASASADEPPMPEPLATTTDAAGYRKAVDTVLEEIARGNVYQANYCQRFRFAAPADPWTLYTFLRRINPAPFGAYLRLPDGGAILSSSPERFLRVDGARRVEGRPIKGTRPRGETELDDARLEEELEQSEKDRAENLMIVDLVRNDLGRVCAPGTIEVPELMTIEGYAAVFQMVSTVTGRLAEGRDAIDLLAASFPPGSMTGAPKLAAMELLTSLESVRRDVYAGGLGYLDLRGGLDLSVVIRTFLWKEGEVVLHVGGGVVADSTPESEFLESLDKARAPLRALAAALEETRP